MPDPNVRPPNKVTYDYGQFKNAPGTARTAGVPDTFFGPRNKVYADFIARRITRLRGTNAYYYVLADASERIDGDRPISDADRRGRVDAAEGDTALTHDEVFARKRHAGMALYGEHVIVKRRLDSVRREIQPDWSYLDPILVSGLVDATEHDTEPDERGSIRIRRCEYRLARVLCDREWDLQPQAGDIVRFPKLLDQYMDVERVEREEARMGSTGFFVEYKLTLVKTSKFEPQRKIAERKLADDAPPTGAPDDPSPGGLS